MRRTRTTTSHGKASNGEPGVDRDERGVTRESKTTTGRGGEDRWGQKTALHKGDNDGLALRQTGRKLEAGTEPARTLHHTIRTAFPPRQMTLGLIPIKMHVKLLTTTPTTVDKSKKAGAENGPPPPHTKNTHDRGER